MARHKHIDKKDVTLHIRSSILNLYFETLVGEGRWDKDAKKDLVNKYYLTDKQFDILSPPALSQTRLHFIEGWDLSGLSDTLHQIHGNARGVAKVY